MFDLNSILRLLTIIGAILLWVGSINGFINNNCTSDILISIHLFIMGIMILYFEFFRDKAKTYFYNEYLFRTLFLGWNGVLMLGVNSINIGFGIYNIIIGIFNALIFISLDEYNDESETIV